MSKVRYLVTGGAGFIGSNLGRELLARPDVDEVIALDDLSTGDRANLDGTGIQLLEGTILDPETLDVIKAELEEFAAPAPAPAAPAN